MPIDVRRRLCAVLAADAVGYSRLMAIDDRRTLEALEAARAAFKIHIEANQGRVVDMAGDSVLAVFDTAMGAVTAALTVQSTLRQTTNADHVDQPLRFELACISVT